MTRNASSDGMWQRRLGVNPMSNTRMTNATRAAPEGWPTARGLASTAPWPPAFVSTTSSNFSKHATLGGLASQRLQTRRPHVNRPRINKAVSNSKRDSVTLSRPVRLVDPMRRRAHLRHTNLSFNDATCSIELLIAATWSNIHRSTAPLNEDSPTRRPTMAARRHRAAGRKARLGSGGSRAAWGDSRHPHAAMRAAQVKVHGGNAAPPHTVHPERAPHSYGCHVAKQLHPIAQGASTP